MKRIKMFEEMGYGNAPLSYDTDSELDSELDLLRNSKLTPERLKAGLIDIFNFPTPKNRGKIETIIMLLSKVKEKYPEVKTDPTLKEIWDDAVKKIK